MNTCFAVVYLVFSVAVIQHLAILAHEDIHWEVEMNDCGRVLK